MRNHNQCVYILTNKNHFRNVNDAIACEKKLNGWRRSRKIAVVERTKPRRLDLSDDWEQRPNVYATGVQHDSSDLRFSASLRMTAV